MRIDDAGVPSLTWTNNNIIANTAAAADDSRIRTVNQPYIVPTEVLTGEGADPATIVNVSRPTGCAPVRPSRIRIRVGPWPSSTVRLLL